MADRHSLCRTPEASGPSQRALYSVVCMRPLAYDDGLGTAPPLRVACGRLSYTVFRWLVLNVRAPQLRAPSRLALGWSSNKPRIFARFRVRVADVRVSSLNVLSSRLFRSSSSNGTFRQLLMNARACSLVFVYAMMSYDVVAIPCWRTSCLYGSVSACRNPCTYGRREVMDHVLHQLHSLAAASTCQTVCQPLFCCRRCV